MRTPDETTVWIGLDIGKTEHFADVLDEAGSPLFAVAVANDEAAIEALIARAESFGSPALVVDQPGSLARLVLGVAARRGVPVAYVPGLVMRRAADLYPGESKTDRSDAEHLARLGRFDPKLLSPIRHRGARAQADLQTLRSRDALVRARTALINHVRGAVKAWGAALPSCTTPAFHRTVESHIPEELRPALLPLLRQIEHLTGEIRQADKQIAAMCERYAETGALRQIVGVGPITSLTFILTIEDPARFPKNREVGPYLGLVPRSRDSGDRQPQLRITKDGDAALRRVLNQAAHYILGPFGPDSDLRRWGLRYAESGAGNAKKRAVVAVARRLAVLLLALWKSGEVYDPLRQARAAEAA